MLLQYSKNGLGRIAALKGGPFLWDFAPFLSQKINKIKWGTQLEKVSQCRKKLKRGTLGIFYHFRHKSSQKLKGDPLKSFEIFRKKSHKAEKTGREEPLGFFNISVAKHQEN